MPVSGKNLDFYRYMLWSFFVLNNLRWKVHVRFVDIDGIVDLLFKLSFHKEIIWYVEDEQGIFILCWELFGCWRYEY
jgi:hypothetical protein